VIYMPRKTLAGFVEAARAAGLDPATPAVAVASATRSAQAHVAGRADEIAALAASLPAGAPVTVILGRVARHVIGMAALLSEAA
jgi:uroporphyrin-III C-methyltransferase / precorrin-2 dehydrogenase / sirohydrochlorin ferrochelatase